MCHRPTSTPAWLPSCYVSAIGNPGDPQPTGYGSFPNEGPQLITPGVVVVITEGRRNVAYFHVDSVDAEDVGGSALRS